jgi:hypothetical protein
MKIDIVIFSRNRACQLHSLLQSINDNFRFPSLEVFVLFRFDGRRYRKAYEKLQERELLDPIHWVHEGSFRKDLLNLFKSMNRHDLFMFMVDDNIVFRPLTETIAFKTFSQNHLFLSTRCSRKYSKGELPVFSVEDRYLEWEWNYNPGVYTGWNYPFSLDGNIYRVEFLFPLLEQLRFRAPNSLERALHTIRFDTYVLSRPKALALLEPIVFNNPLNRVQVEWETWHGDVSAKELNDRYLEGFVINNTPLYRAQPSDYHYLVTLGLVRGPVFLHEQGSS